MTEPICKVADIIYVRFELTEFEEQKKYFDHFGLMLAYEDENSIFFRGDLYYHFFFSLFFLFVFFYSGKPWL
mgnify:CR=1 FL=1